MASAVITYEQRIIQNAANLVVTPVSNGVDVMYGDWTGAPLHEASRVNFTIRYNSISQTVNADNSVTVSFTMVVGTFTRTVTNASVTDNTTVTAEADGNQFWNFAESITAPSTHAGYSRSFSVTVPPLGTSWLAAVHFNNDMSQGDDEFDVGMKIYNPNPPDYRPGQRRQAGVWESHNRSAGVASVRSGGAWVEMRTEPGAGNPPSIRRSGAWVNQAKIGANAG